MKAVYRVLGIASTLAIVASPSFAADTRDISGTGPGVAATGYSCDEGTFDNAFFMNEFSAYGNAFDVGAGGPLSSISYWHFGWSTLSGPYDYNVRVWDDATCTEVANLTGYEAADAFSEDQLEEEDLCDAGVSVSGTVFVGVEALSCFDPTDCYPDVWLDETGTINGCGRIVDTVGGTCTVADTGAGGVDFVLSITVDECDVVPTEAETWSGVKSLYR